MNPSRLVAAVAASAVGLGITLVGVTLADSNDVASTVADRSDDLPAQDLDADDDDANDAEQEIVEADEPDAATVDTEVGSTIDQAVDETQVDQVVEEEVQVDEVDAADGDPPESAEAPPVDDSPGADRAPSDSIDEQRVDRPAAGCFDVVVLDDSDRMVLRKGIEYQLVDGEITLLDGVDGDVDVRLLEDVDEISIAVDGGEIVSCADGIAIESDPLLAFFVSAPCDGEVRDYFEEFFDSLSDSDVDSGSTDEEMFVRVVAERIERVNPASDRIAEFIAGVDEAFAGFTDECAPIVSTIDLRTDRFFCAVGNLSVTEELNTYLRGPLGLPGCEYVA